jgi:hypothetical protein
MKTKMENKKGNESIIDVINKTNQFLENSKKVNSLDKLFDAFDVYKKGRWETENKTDGNARICLYDRKLRSFLQKFTSANEEDFIRREMTALNLVLKSVNMNDPVQESAYYHAKKYNEFLKERQEEIALIKSKINDESSGDKPLSFYTNRTQTVAIFLLLKDSGFFGGVSDYRLAKFIEKNVLYDGNKPMTGIANEISQLRDFEKDPKKQEEYLKNILSNAEIKTND